MHMGYEKHDIVELVYQVDNYENSQQIVLQFI
jgi:hypothetical protein